MGAWERGINSANALHIGGLNNENDRLENRKKALEGDVSAMAVMIADREVKLQTYQ